MGTHHGKVMPEEKSSSESDKIIFLYDFRSASKHFICGTYLFDVAKDENNIKRYDDFEIIQHRRGVEIRKIAFFRKDGKIVGYEIEYFDSKKKKLILKRIAKKYSHLTIKEAEVLKLSYNEHLADIEVVYNNDDIKYVEVVTSRGQILKCGNQPDDCYTSVSKVDVTTRLFAPIVGIASTFTHEAMKEIFIYRCTVRISKRKFKKEYTVNEINVLKSQPAHEPLKTDLIRDITKKSMAQMKVLKAFDNILNKTKTTPVLQTTISMLSKPEPKSEKKVDALEKYDMGIESDEEEEEQKKEEKPLTAKEKMVKTLSGKLGLFKNSSGKLPTSNANKEPDLQKRKTNFFKEIFSPSKIGFLAKKNSMKNMKLGEGKEKSKETDSEKKSPEPVERRSSLFAYLKKHANGDSSNSPTPERKNSGAMFERLFKTSVAGSKASIDDDKSNVSSPGITRPLVIPLNKTEDGENSANQSGSLISEKIKSKLIGKLGMARKESLPKK